MGRLTVVGVRHHSPACARLVRHVVERERPDFVLIEGPSDMNPRLDELYRPHALPIAVFSWHQRAEGETRGSWAPFCDYSPEWVALQSARDVGATARFIDLPAWHEALAGDENRYGDRHLRTSDRLLELAGQLGFEGVDALWDHLFEGPQDPAELEPRLSRYFQMLRADEPPAPGDGEREDFMRAHLAWALASGSAVVVCGGYHQPVLETGWESLPPVEPRVPIPAEGRVGSYLTPYSFHRLDAFQGYSAGMPSPGFYQEVWEHGAGPAAEMMLHACVRRLRAKSQQISAADAIAATTLMEGLRRLRGHEAPLRVDVLDALAGALVKDALDAPLPWTLRGPLARRTAPLLVELVAAFSGERRGELAPGTPQPPLVADVLETLRQLGLTPGPAPLRIQVELSTPEGRRQSHVLHRLRILEVPGFERTRGPDFRRHRTRLSEEWTLQRRVESDAALIEASAYGGTLEAAAAAKLEARSLQGAGLRTLAEVVVAASSAGLSSLGARWLAALRVGVSQEPSLGDLGSAATQLLALRHGEVVLGSEGVLELGEILAVCLDRGLWLFEGIDGAQAPYDASLVMAVLSLRELVREEGHPADLARTKAVGLRRAADPAAPPALRGAGLGLAWSLDGVGADEALAVTLLKACASPATLGDFLSGLFALARDRLPRSGALMAAIDGAVTAMTPPDFFVALPSLRQAFAFFPPRERLHLAEVVVARGTDATVDPMSLLELPVAPRLVVEGERLERAAAELARRFGLGDALDAEERSDGTCPETRSDAEVAS